MPCFIFSFFQFFWQTWKNEKMTSLSLLLHYSIFRLKKKKKTKGEKGFSVRGFLIFSLAEFILATNYPSKQIICQTDNSSRYKSEDEF